MTKEEKKKFNKAIELLRIARFEIENVLNGLSDIEIREYNLKNIRMTFNLINKSKLLEN